MKSLVLFLTLISTSFAATITEVRLINGHGTQVIDQGTFIISQYNSSRAQALYDQWQAGDLSVDELNEKIKVLEGNQLSKARELGFSPDPDCSISCSDRKDYMMLMKFDGIPSRVLYTHIIALQSVEHEYFDYKATISFKNRFSSIDKNATVEIDLLVGVGFAMTPQDEVQDFIDETLTQTDSLYSQKTRVIEKDALVK